MKRVVSPTRRLKEVDSSHAPIRYKPDKNGVFEVTDRDAKLLVAYGGFLQPVAGMGKRSEGYRCACGFGSWFTTCSRCGGECVREA